MYLYLFPTELEAAPFRRQCADSEVVISGVGAIATAATLAKLYREGRVGEGVVVVLCGIAGSYDANLAYGEVVEVVEECCAELPERFRVTYRNNPATELRGVRSNTVHGTSCEPCGAEIENMEGAALFAVANTLGFRAVQIRAISNRVGESFEHWHLNEALESLTSILKTLSINEQ